VKSNFYKRKADLFLSKTDPDASPMKRKGADHIHLGYQAHCVVDGGKARTSWVSLSPPSRSPRRDSDGWARFVRGHALHLKQSTEPTQVQCLLDPDAARRRCGSASPVAAQRSSLIYPSGAGWS
jgi:hypothetical protein